MKRMIAVLLALVMVVSMVGCSSGDADKLVGTWEADVNLSSTISEMLDSLGQDSAEYFDFSDFSVTMVITFNDDGTYAMTLDEASTQAAFDGLMEDVEAGMVKMLEAQIAENGLDMTVDELLEASGMNLDDLMAEMKTSFADEDIISDMVDESTTEGNFEAKDGKLYLSDGKDFAVDEAIYDTYVLDGDTLTLQEHVGDDAAVSEALEDTMYPITFEKVN